MTDRASVFEDTIIGVEVTPGTSVAVTKRLSATGISSTPNIATRRFRPMGRKMDTLVIPGKSSTEASIEGAGTYYDLVYLLSSIMGKVTPVLVPTSVSAYDWTFIITPGGPDIAQTYTVESGSSVRASKFTGGLVTELGIEINSDEINISGAMIGRVYQDGVTKTVAGVTDTATTPILPDAVDVTSDATFAAIGTTKLLRALSASVNISNKYAPLWVLDSAQTSFAGHVETAPDITATLMTEADAAGMALFPLLQAGTTRFIRIKNIGPTVVTTFNHEIEIDLAVKVEAINSLGDQDGVYGAEWALRAVDDALLDGIKIRIRNGLAAL